MAEPEPAQEPEGKSEHEVWAEAATMFNDPEISASKAIEFMEEHNFLEPTPAGVARLFREKAGNPRKGGLDKREIGEYLAKLKPYNNDVRQAYVETFDFTGKSFVSSLREFLNSFRLPGESMLIERIFSAWASRYYRNNPGDFATSILTEEKIAQIRKAFDTFATQAGDAGEGGGEGGSDGGDNAGSKGAAPKSMGEVIHSGWMNKKGEKNNRFKKRWFEIQRLGEYDRLTYMEKEGGKPKGTINLSTCNGAMPSMEDPLQLELIGRKPDGTERAYVFKCDDEESAMTWVNQIMRSLAQHVSAKAEEAKAKLAGTGVAKSSDLFEMVRSIPGGDFKYMKDPDLLEMQHITEKELRMVAPALGHEVSFEDAREMAESSQRAKAGNKDEPISFLTFLTMVAFKLGLDTAFVLAYTTIMLNTDAHNMKLKGQKRLTCADFIANNRRSEHLASFSDSFFEQLYSEIVSNEIKMEGEEEEDEEAADQADAGETSDASPSAEPVVAPAVRELTPEESARLEKWKEGAAMFNDPEVSASKAIEFMEENDLVEPNAQGVARLFREKAGPPSQGGLDKKEIGEFLAKLKPYNNDVRQAFVESFDFTGKSFVDALREFLNAFRLPGESMLIERLFSAWSARYYRNNPGDFASSLLSRAKVEEFGSAFDAFAKEHPSGDSASQTVADQTPAAAAGSEADGAPSSDTEPALLHAGWMEKKGENNNTFKKRWFEITRGPAGVCKLVYREKEGGKEKGGCSLDTSCDGAVPSMENTLVFTLLSRKPDGSEREYVIKCEDEESAMVWVNTVTKCVAEAVQRKADAAERRLSKIGTIKASDLYEMVRSLGGDFKYLKDPELEQMQQITEKELRFVAPILETEVNFKDARNMAATARSGEGTIDFLTFLTMVAFKLGFDTAFVLAYSTIMLNTDAHNEKLKGQKRLTCADFIANNRRSEHLASFPDSFFEQLYSEIVSNEIKMEGEEDEDASADESFSQDLRESIALGGAPQETAAAAASGEGGGSPDGWATLGFAPRQASARDATNDGSAASAAEPRAEEGVPPVSAGVGATADTSDGAVTSADTTEHGGDGKDEVAEPASKKLEKLVKAQQQGALSQEMFHRLVSKATAELPAAEPLRQKLEKLQNALDAGALTPDMFGKMLIKQINAAGAEAEAAAEQAKLMAMFAGAPGNTAPVERAAGAAEARDPVKGEDAVAGDGAEPSATEVQGDC